MHQVGIAILSMFMSLSSLAAAADGTDPMAFKAFDDIANHYKCYQVKAIIAQPLPVALRDQFGPTQAEVLRVRYLCNPVKKNDTPIVDYDLHYVCFDIIDHNPGLEPPRVRTSNQFGTQVLQPIQAELLCLPSKKEHIE